MQDGIDLAKFKEIFVEESREYLLILNKNLLQLEKNPQNLDLLNEIFRAAHTLKGMSATMGFEKITRLAHEMENILDRIRNREIIVTDKTVEILFNCFDTLEILIEEVAADEDKAVNIESLIEKLKSIAEIKNNIEEKEKAPVIESAEIKTGTNTVRIKTEHLDKLMNLVGELIINKARLQQVAQIQKISELSSALAQFDRISVDLQEEVLKTRMVPVKSIFDRYPRMVRDLAKKLNKELDFQIIGTEIEIDRTLLEQINEPVVHLLRNAVDHGIEEPEQRKKLGKSERGTVKVTVKREKGYCTIEVSDDGAGMNTEEILRKAKEKGLISDEQAKQLFEIEIFELICKPGFSTTEKTTDISGRGVGMNVVKNILDTFKGTLEITSKENEGSTFIMHFPLTLAVIKALLVKVVNDTYAIPLTNVNEIAKIEAENIRTVDKKEVLMLRDEVIPLIRLSDLFEIQDSLQDRIDYAVISEINNKKFGIVADSLVGQQEIVVKTLSDIHKYVRNFTGATILGDGSVVLIIDVPSLLQSRN